MRGNLACPAVGLRVSKVSSRAPTAPEKTPCLTRCLDVSVVGLRLHKLLAWSLLQLSLIGICCTLGSPLVLLQLACTHSSAHQSVHSKKNKKVWPDVNSLKWFSCWIRCLGHCERGKKEPSSTEDEIGNLNRKRTSRNSIIIWKTRNSVVTYIDSFLLHCKEAKPFPGTKTRQKLRKSAKRTEHWTRWKDGEGFKFIPSVRSMGFSLHCSGIEWKSPEYRRSIKFSENISMMRSSSRPCSVFVFFCKRKWKEFKLVGSVLCSCFLGS